MLLNNEKTAFKVVKVVKRVVNMNHVQFLHSGVVQVLHSLGMRNLHLGSLGEKNSCWRE